MRLLAKLRSGQAGASHFPWQLFIPCSTAWKAVAGCGAVGKQVIVDDAVVATSSSRVAKT